MEEATPKLEAAQGQQINQRPGVEVGTRSTTPRNYEVKWSGPDGVVLDVSQSVGWRALRAAPHQAGQKRQPYNAALPQPLLASGSQARLAYVRGRRAGSCYTLPSIFAPHQHGSRSR